MRTLSRELFFASFAVRSATALYVRDYLAPLYGANHSSAIEGDYIVGFNEGYTLEHHWQAIGKDLSAEPGFIDFRMMPGYAVEMDDDTLNSVRRDPSVYFVEMNAELDTPEWDTYTEATLSNNTVDGARHFKRDYNTVTNPAAPYGLQMVGAGEKLSPPVQDEGTYNYLYRAGEGVNIYILDTGINIDDPRFQGRASNFGGLKQSDTSPYIDEPMKDEDGHGTHVAGTAGSQQYGVAPYANLVNVKVLGARLKARKKMIAKAIFDIIEEHKHNRATKKKFDFRGSVINMSLGFSSFWWSLDRAIGWAHWYGITMVAAAGNENTFGEYYYPCAYDTVMCVAAVDRNYKRYKYSNYGLAVDFTAPGVAIESLSMYRNITSFRSGTSMATPHVSGIAAIFISWLGLANDDAASYVWWNSLSGITSGMGWWFDRSSFATTGIHSSKKYPKEPFRWAGDDPATNPQIQSLNNTDVVSAATTTPPTLAPSLLLSSPFTSFDSTILVTRPTSTDTTVYTHEPSIADAGNNATQSTAFELTRNATTTPPPTPAPTKPSPTPLAPPQPSCYSAFDDHSDIHEFMQSNFASKICDGLKNDGHKIKQDDSTSEVHEKRFFQAWENAYKYDIYWQAGCKTDVTERDAFDPMGATHYNCTSLLERDYRQCNNGGAGGKATVGCVTYEFSIGAKDSDS